MFNRIYKIFLIALIMTISTNIAFSQNYGNYRPPLMNTPSYASNRENVLIILDSSYSMNDKINGERKIDIAKRVINQVLSNLSPNIRVGLRVYGHKSSFLGINSCRASELKVPIGEGTQRFISNQLLKIQPEGWTPISYSLAQAVDYDFNGVLGKKRIILVSDGMETCDGSPCDFAINLVRKGIELKIDVIGFDLTEEMAKSQLKCVALATKGKFYTANSAGELAKYLNNSLNSSKEVQGRIMNKYLGN